MGERGGKTISMNDEISPVYMVSRGTKTKRSGTSERFISASVNDPPLRIEKDFLFPQSLPMGDSAKTKQ